MGESATAMGRGRAVGPMPASRPTGRSSLGYPLALEWRNLRLNCQWHTTTTASHCKGQRRCEFPSRCGAVTGPWISGHTDACKASSESCWRGRATRPIFDPRETGSAVLARAGARSESVAASDRATGLGRLSHLKISAPSVVARILVWARDATDFRPSINGGATVPVAARRRRACR